MVTNLPGSLEDLGGLRAARWIRESTERQTDRFGPDAQREQQDRTIDRFGLADTGPTWQVAHSGRTIATTSQFAEMMSAAGRDFDILLVGYVSRFARDLRTAVNAWTPGPVSKRTSGSVVPIGRSTTTRRRRLA